METTTNENRKGLLQNDRLLVCGMLVFYGLCCLGLFGGGFWWLNQSSQRLSASATSMAQAIATQQAQGTATAVVHATELAQYELIDPFDSNVNHWRTGAEESDYWTGSTQITSGVYIWDVQEVKDGFVAWSDFPGNDFIKNYDTYVDTKIVEGPSGNPCSGLIFRKSALGWDTGGYSFVVCRSGYFSIDFHNAQAGWQGIGSQYHPSIRPFDWNRLEVLVRGSHFVFLINGQVVYETDDDRQSVGGVALLIDVEEPGTQILFDNFGYQSR
jgi:hypothetical protein